MKRPSLAPEILRYYLEVAEEDRLAGDRWRLERERTWEILSRVLPPPPATVLDVGGAAGVYALPLAECGYAVHLLDAVPRLVRVARRRNAGYPRPLAASLVGDARELPWPAAVADAVLLLGPLYHLQDAADRLTALREGRRVLRPGGVLVAAAISRWASALDGLVHELFGDPVFSRMVEQDVATGRHDNPKPTHDLFTTAYFHRPDELRREVEEAGLRCGEILGVEGPGWLLGEFEQRWADRQRRQAMLGVARLVEGEPDLTGVSAHLLAVARKPQNRPSTPDAV